MNGAQHILEAFHRHHIDTVFGYPGGCIMPLYDALVDDGVVEHVLCRHEQACALAADGYARASGKTGVCLATSGPGATNLITGVANAHRDSIPMVVITGQVPTSLIGTDAFQETDVLGMALGIVKHSYLVEQADELPDVMEAAFRLANEGRPGPVWIDIPKDILLAEIDTPAAIAITDTAAEDIDISAALTLIRSSQRPLLYSGGGVSRSHGEAAFRAFAEISGIPGVATLNGLGNAGKRAGHDLGMLGMHGSRAANRAVAECDLLLVIGARLDDRATGKLEAFAPKARTIHIDADAAEFNKLRTVDVALRGNLPAILQALAEAIRRAPLAIGDWQQTCRHWHTTGGFHAADNDDPFAPINGPAFISQLSRIAPDDTVIACDVGQHQMWIAQYYDFDHPRHHLTSGGLGTMGFGLPAAIGAQFANRGSTVINVTGDGSFMMNPQELATIRRYQLPVKIIILDNQCLGMVRQQQELFYNNRESHIDLDDNPDFLTLAKAFDIHALHINRSDQIRRGIETLLAYPGPMLLHVAIARDENVWPIVRPGSGNTDMIDETHRPRNSNKEHVA